MLDTAGASPAAAISSSGGPLLPVAVEVCASPTTRRSSAGARVGSREDEVDGGRSETVFYERGGERVRYSIVAGDALAEPDGEDIEAGGTRLRRIGDGAPSRGGASATPA